jgi:hypothetical protein
MRKVMRSAAMLWLLVLASASTARADAPVREPLPASTTTLGAAVCGFPVTIAVAENKEFVTTFSSGNVLVTGHYVADITGNGTTITVNASGPVLVTPASVTFRGGALLFAYPGDLGPGTPGSFILAHGPVTVVYDASGGIASVDIGHARTVDLCARLAADGLA